MQPRYLTLSSSGSTNWQTVNWNGDTPMMIGFAVTASGLTSGWQIDVCMADQSGTFPSTVSTVFQASQVGGPAGSTTNAIGAISTCPIAAWRLTLSSTGGSVHCAALMQGIG